MGAWPRAARCTSPLAGGTVWHRWLQAVVITSERSRLVFTGLITQNFTQPVELKTVHTWRHTCITE